MSFWQKVHELVVIPYIDGKPAGTSKEIDVVWSNEVIYVKALHDARLAHLVPERLGKIFGRFDISSALSYCYGRSPSDVTEYLKENFFLTDPGFPITEEDLRLTATIKEFEPLSAPDVIHPAEDVLDPFGKVPEIPGEVIPDILAEKKADSTFEDVTDDHQLPEVVDPKPRTYHKPGRASIVELFFQNLGYRKAGEDNFIHRDGASLARSRGDIFPWVRYSSSGEIICRYWTKDHCLELEPLQIQAEIWGLIEKFPEKYAFLLADLQGNPIEIRGEKLGALRESGYLKLYPATYRLVYENEHE